MKRKYKQEKDDDEDDNFIIITSSFRRMITNLSSATNFTYTFM